jgi:alkylation response protein AidB-like acyl-CoA dehydrogenase
MSIASLALDLPALTPAAETLRTEIRAWIAEERAAGRLNPPTRLGMGWCEDTSRRIAAKGWIGMTWPREYGGGGRSALERYVMNEELLAAAVPVRAHWTADRQQGPVILKFGSEDQKRKYIPGIIAGETYFCIGLSEPEAGSDLASLKTRATKVEGGWQVNGRKIWTSNAHRAHFMIALVRTSPAGEARHAGMSQLIIDLASPGITVSPIIAMTGEHDFNEVLFADVFVPDDCLIGTEGNGWHQGSTELAYERSGPERWLTSFCVISELVGVLGSDVRQSTLEALGGLIAQLLTLRQLSLSVASMIERGLSPNVEAAVVKDLGTKFEQESVRVVRDIVSAERMADPALLALLADAQVAAPSFTIRGGANEILRGVIARAIGLR